MIEVQIRNESVYNELKPLASYASDLTRVCAFRDELLQTLQENGVEVDSDVQHSIIGNAKKPFLTVVNGNVMKLENAPAEMLYFVGVRSEFDPTISVRFMHEVKTLLDQGLVTADAKFKELYCHLGYRSKVSELVCAKVKFQGKGKLVDFVDPSLTVQSLKFPDTKQKQVKYRQIQVKCVMYPGSSRLNLEPKEGDNVQSGKYSAPYVEFNQYWECFVVQCDRNGKPIEDGQHDMVLRFYNRPLILKSVLYVGNRFNIACGRVTETREGYLSCYDPLILPKGMDLREDIAYSPPNRAIPADLYRNALFEFQLRYDFDKWAKEVR